MPCADRTTTLNLLAIKKSPYLDSLRSSIPRLPVELAAEPDLPRWRQLPLESKIPLDGVPLLARRKLGEALRLDPPQFDTSDPYNYEVRLDYEGLHDPHLTRFFGESEHLREAIVKTGLVSPRFDVKCSLKDYNAYRSYLRTMQAKLMRLELEKRDEMRREKFILDIAERQAAKIIEKLKKDETRNALLKELKLKEEIKLRRIKQKHKELDDRLEALTLSRWKTCERKKLESTLKRESFGRKRAAMAKREQQTLLNTLKEWHERDRRLKKNLETNSAMRRQAKLNEALNKFEKKKLSQEEALEREKLLKDCAVTLKEAFLESYEERMNRDRRKMQELLDEKKKKIVRKIKLRSRSRKSSSCLCRVN
ncbi:hypothetical protein TSAR_005197 [Trichomalopsis sarcophagae]|uniref:Fibrous sheath-interacting protein 2 C-terminal domain-containing protein n=1 Tax=Trichomalopsis sarcophagae TaxID=543379 RepID=A0A232F9S1_9HYME|nr:hypothetical protein TSAR_005197 [Trichomalopsis sarcophagae]